MIELPKWNEFFGLVALVVICITVIALARPSLLPGITRLVDNVLARLMRVARRAEKRKNDEQEGEGK